MSSADEARELQERARDCAQHSAERVDMLDRAARLADSAADARLGYEIRDDLIEAAVFAGEPQRAMVAFAWCLALCDESPEEFPESNLHWKYKWMAQSIADFPEVSREQVFALLDDMQARFQRRGVGENAVLKLRALAAEALGDVAELERYFSAWNGASRDELSDCNACDISQQIGLLTRLGRDDEAIDKMQHLLDSRQRCLEVPAMTYGMIQFALLRKHDLAKALAYHRVGYPQLKQLRKDGVPHIGEHLALLAVANEHGRGLRILRDGMPLAADHAVGFPRLRFLVGAQVLLQRASTRQETATLTVPPAFGGDGKNDKRDLASVAALFADRARALAAAFDRRNGNTGMSGWTEERLALATLELSSLPSAP